MRNGWHDKSPAQLELKLARDRIKESRHAYQVETDYASARYCGAVSSYYDELLEREPTSRFIHLATPEELEELSIVNKELRQLVADLWLDGEADKGYGASSPFEGKGGIAQAQKRRAILTDRVVTIVSRFYNRHRRQAKRDERMKAKYHAMGASR